MRTISPKTSKLLKCSSLFFGWELLFCSSGKQDFNSFRWMVCPLDCLTVGSSVAFGCSNDGQKMRVEVTSQQRSFLWTLCDRIEDVCRIPHPAQVAQPGCSKQHVDRGSSLKHCMQQITGTYCRRGDFLSWNARTVSLGSSLNLRIFLVLSSKLGIV